MHQYLDNDGSGTSSTIANNDPNIGVERLTEFTQWLDANHLRGFLGEFAAANSTMGRRSDRQRSDDEHAELHASQQQCLAGLDLVGRGAVVGKL